MAQDSETRIKDLENMVREAEERWKNHEQHEVTDVQKALAQRMKQVEAKRDELRACRTQHQVRFSVCVCVCMCVCCQHFRVCVYVRMYVCTLSETSAWMMKQIEARKMNICVMQPIPVHIIYLQVLCYSNSTCTGDHACWQACILLHAEIV